MASEQIYDGNNEWLHDAEVRSEINLVKGRWEVSLIFIDATDPRHFLIQEIGDYHSERLAKIYAENITKTTAKDSRGTQKVKTDAYDINNN